MPLTILSVVDNGLAAKSQANLLSRCSYHANVSYLVFIVCYERPFLRRLWEVYEGSSVPFLQTLVKKEPRMVSYSHINISCSPTAHPEMYSGRTDMYPSTFLSITDTSEQLKTVSTCNNGKLVKNLRLLPSY